MRIQKNPYLETTWATSWIVYHVHLFLMHLNYGIIIVFERIFEEHLSPVNMVLYDAKGSDKQWQTYNLVITVMLFCRVWSDLLSKIV